MQVEKRSPRDALAAHAGLMRKRDEKISDTFDGRLAAGGHWSGAGVESTAAVASGLPSRGDVNDHWGAYAASLLAKLWSRVFREREIRRMTAQLQALDDRMLQDIGTSRCEIELVVRHGRH
jgi:uncharacterized protein YjiS (DUF1127 family)